MDYPDGNIKFEKSMNSNFSQMFEIDGSSYLRNLQEINKNLRSQLDYMYKLIRMKLKLDSSERLKKIVRELESLKMSLDFTMQKHENIVSKYNF